MNAQPNSSRRAAEKTPPRRVLVVDDNADAAELAGDLLRSVGHDVRAARSGAEALALLASFDLEVAILDLEIAGMDGCELAEKIAAARRAAGKPVPMLVALTGRGQAQDRSRTQAAGFSRHLVKPVDANQLFASVQPG